MRIVTVTRAVPGPPARVWQALTDPAAMAAWFGTITAPLATDGLSTITLPDGDLFLAQLIAADSPTTLEYVWAALGVGVENTVTWRITPQGLGSLVTVTDEEPERPDAQVPRDVRRWQEILRRLERHLAGAAPETPCQDQFDASVEFAATVEGAGALLVEPSVHGRWLPLVGAALVDGATLRVDDGQDPRDFRITEVRVDAGRHRIGFRIGHPDWRHPTVVTLAVGTRRRGAVVTVTHDGWRGIGSDAARQQRARWCAVWSTALRRFTLLYVRGREQQVIPARELNARLGEPGIFVFDTNVPYRWERGHLRDAIHVGPAPLAPEALPADKAATLVFYCLSPL